MGAKARVLEIHSERRLNTPVHPGIGILRRAIRGNIVSFPAQIPSLLKEPAAGIQRRMVVLFFVCGWRSAEIAARFHVPAHRMRKDLDAWSVRAVALGYVQVIDPDGFARCCREGVEYGGDDDREEVQSAGGGLAPERVPKPVARPATARGEHVAADRERSEDRRAVLLPESARPVVALDRAIERCEELREEFQLVADALLRELRTVEGMTLELRRSRVEADGFAARFQSGEIDCQPRLSVSQEEQVSHAVV
jgi:hypothetical protein